MSAVKALLGVRASCHNISALIESGLSNLSALIKERQYKFYKKLINSREHMTDDPFMHMLKTARENRSPAARYLDNLLKATDVSFIQSDYQAMTELVRQSLSSKLITYREMNADLTRHSMYDDYRIPEFRRISVTRFRTSCHRLKIETGRWSRVPRDRRLCTCGRDEIQDEAHVIESCFHLTSLRHIFPGLNFSAQGFFENRIEDVAAFVHEAMAILE